MFPSTVASRLMSTAYRSSVCLASLYPKSSLNITAPVKIAETSGTNFSGYIPIEKLEIRYSRSSGPGGQHVNTTSSKVDIRFHVETATWLSTEIKTRLLESYKSKISKDGYLIVKSEKTRSQIYNQADAITTLRQLIWKAATPHDSTPSEETLHKLRKRKEKANIQRLIEKRAHSQKKLSRRDDDICC